jgi:hypothetical protein
MWMPTAAGALLIAVAAIMGTVMDIGLLSRWGGAVPMVPLTSLCLMAVVVALSLRPRYDALAGGVTAGVIMTVVGRLAGLPNPVEQCCLPVVPPMTHLPDGQMAVASAAALLTAAVSVWLPPRGRWVGCGVIWALVLAAWLAPGWVGGGWMARPTMVGLTCLGFAVGAKKIYVAPQGKFLAGRTAHCPGSR